MLRALLSDRAVAPAGTPTASHPGSGQRWWPSRRGIVARVVVIVAIVAAALAVPVGVPPVYEPIVARAVVYAIIALSMNVLIGYVGQISLGHHAFVGLGAFAAGIAMGEAGLPFVAALAVAGGIGALAALVLGGVALRIGGMYLALVTIAFALFVANTLLNITALTGGGAGMSVPRPAFAVDNVPYIYLCLAILVAIWVIDWRLTASKAGRAIRALRDDERVAASWGIDVTRYKLLAFVLSGITAGIAGTLFAAIEEIATAVTYQSLTFGLIIALMVVVGGAGSRPGAVIGGVLFGVLANVLDITQRFWGECQTGWAGGFVQPVGPVPAPGPRALQVAIGAAFVFGGYRLVRAIPRSRAVGKVARGAGAVVSAGAGVVVAAGAITGAACLWAGIDGTAAPFLLALLTLVVLIAYPGGLAQMLAPVLRWLSFRPFRAAPREDAAGSASAAASQGRP